MDFLMALLHAHKVCSTKSEIHKSKLTLTKIGIEFVNSTDIPT